MYNYFTFLTIFLLLFSTNSQVPLLEFFKALNGQAYDWVTHEDVTRIIQQCKFNESSNELLNLIDKLQQSHTNIQIESIDVIKKYLKSNKKLTNSIFCYFNLSSSPVNFLNEKHKISKIKQFIKKHPQQAQKINNQNYDYSHKGQAIGKFIKAFLEYYYVTVVSESQTLSTVFLRALTIRSSIWDHSDLSYCLTIDDLSTIASLLQNIDINNIFIRLPDLFLKLKTITLREKCADAETKSKIDKLKTKIRDIDYFRYMYQNYTPFVDIATEKYGLTRVRMVARQFANVIDNSDKIQQQQKTTQNPLVGNNHTHIDDI